MNKDLIDDRYGRFYELPRELVSLGHEVAGLCLSYRRRAEGHLIDSGIDNCKVDWCSINLGSLIVPGLIRYFRRLDGICNEFKPDLIYACADALQVIHGVRVARKLDIPCVVDLYDNFESFNLTKLPGILPLFKRAVRRADGVVCVSSNLHEYIEQNYYPRGQVVTISNGIPSKLFHPMDRKECRLNLGLPVDAKLIGTAGALSSSRGIEILFKVAMDLIADDSSIHLVVAGLLDRGVKLPEGANIHYLGELDYEQVPMLLNALDVGIICNRDSSFGRYCFPQKAHEMLACGISVVAADVGTMAELFIEHSECLYAPENQYDLSKTIRNQLFCPTRFRHRGPTWAELAKDMENLLREMNNKFDLNLFVKVD